MVRQSGVFFVSGEFAFTDRFPSWKQGGSPERRAAGSADFARELDELGFDAIFIADFLGLNRSQVANRSARHFEPLTAASHLAAMTSRIGLVITISTQFTEPYNTARQLNSLDWLSQGRIGWNVVTSFNGERNYGYDAGFTRWGFEDVEMCLRTWLLGYRVAVQPDVTVAHYFREARDNYEVDDAAVTYNFLRMVYLHFSPTRIQQVREAVRGNPHVAVAQDRLADSDVFDRRAALLARRAHDDAWFFDEVNGSPAAVL